MEITFDLLQTTGIAALVVFVGEALLKRSKIMQKYCIPAPVISGLLVSLILMVLKLNNILTVNWTLHMQEWTMDLFFTTVGFGASIKLLRKGGKLCGRIAFTICALILAQNFIAMTMAKAFGLHPLIGLSIGSVAMDGGVGTAAAFGPKFEEIGAVGATEIGIAAATFGMIFGSLTGGPVARRIITKNKFSGENKEISDDSAQGSLINSANIIKMFFVMILIASLGTIISALLNKIPHLEIPYFVGCILSGVIARNFMEIKQIPFYEEEIETISSMMLDLFLAQALMTLDLTKLIGAAGYMFAILAAMVLLMIVWARFVTYNLCGRNYDAAVMAAGHCGLGLGAGPNALANERAVMAEHGYSELGWLLFPAFALVVDDIFNPFVISALMSLYK